MKIYFLGKPLELVCTEKKDVQLIMVYLHIVEVVFTGNCM